MAAGFRMLPAITVSGTPAAVTAATNIYAASVMIQAAGANTDYCYVGSSSMTTATGIMLGTGQVASLSFDQVYGVNGKIRLSDIYVAGDNGTNKVRVMYTLFEGA